MQWLMEDLARKSGTGGAINHESAICFYPQHQNLRMDTVFAPNSFFRAGGDGKVTLDEKLGELPLGTKVVTDTSKGIMLDVTVVDAQAESHRKHSVSSTKFVGASSRHAEDSKRRTYFPKQTATKTGGSTYPIREYSLRAGAFEAQGGLGMELVSLLDLMATHAIGATEGDQWRKAGYLRRMKQRISTVLQQAVSDRVMSFTNKLQPAAEYVSVLEADDF
jgi:hypothetical protein